MNKVILYLLIFCSANANIFGQNCGEYESQYIKKQYKKIINKATEAYRSDKKDMCSLNYLLLSLHASIKYDDLKSITSKAIQDEIAGSIQFSPEVYNTISTFFEVKNFGMIQDPETKKYYDYRFLLALFDNFRETKRMPALVAEKLYISIKNNSYLSGDLNESKIALLYLKEYGFKKGMNLEICKFLKNKSNSSEILKLLKDYVEISKPTSNDLEEFFLYLNSNNLNELSKLYKLELVKSGLYKPDLKISSNTESIKSNKSISDLEAIIISYPNIEKIQTKELENTFYYLKSQFNLSDEETRGRGYDILFKIALVYLKRNGFESEISIDMMDYLNKLIVNDKIDKNYLSGNKEIDISQNLNSNKSFRKEEQAEWENSKAKLYPKKNFIEILETENISFRDVSFFKQIDYELENNYINFKNNKNKISVSELLKLKDDNFKKHLYTRSSLVLIELIKREPNNEKFQNDFLEILNVLPIDIFLSFKKVYRKEVDFVSNLYSNNDTLTIKYNQMLYDRQLYEEAYNNLSKSVKTPLTKLLLFNSTIKFKGLIPGLDYLMGEKPNAASAYNILFDLSFNLNTNEIITASKHIYTNYKKALDSIDITALGHFNYDRSADADDSKIICKELNLEDLKWITKVYREFGYESEAFRLECFYWISKNLEVEEIEKAVLKKDLNPIIASAIFLEYGRMCKEEAFRPGGKGVDRERGKNDCVVVLNKAANYNPNDPYIYKELGFVWQLIGDGNKADFYYNKALKMGASMNGIGFESPNAVKTGPRGGKYIINSAGNKTYISK